MQTHKNQGLFGKGFKQKVLHELLIWVDILTDAFHPFPNDKF